MAVFLSATVLAADHIRTINGTVGHPEEGFLIGNGDLSCSVYQTSDDIVFRLGKGDVWDRRLIYNGVPKTGFTGDSKDLLDGWQVRVHARHALWCAIEGAKALGRDEDLQKEWRERLENLVGEAPGLDKFARYCTYCYPPEHNAYPEALREETPPWNGELEPRGNKDYRHWYLGIIHIGRIGNVRSNSCTPELAYASWRRDLAGWTHPNGLVWAMSLQNYGRAGAWTESLSCMAPFQEMMLQSWDGAIHVFPRWPKSKDASFRDFRAQGAFLVSAAMKGGKIGQVTVRSEKGARCVLAHDRWKVTTADGRTVATGRDEFGRMCFPTVPGGVYGLELTEYGIIK